MNGFSKQFYTTLYSTSLKKSLLEKSDRKSDQKSMCNNLFRTNYIYTRTAQDTFYKTKPFITNLYRHNWLRKIIVRLRTFCKKQTIGFKEKI